MIMGLDRSFEPVKLPVRDSYYRSGGRQHWLYSYSRAIFTKFGVPLTAPAFQALMFYILLHHTTH